MDLGTDIGNVSINAMAKLTEGILKIIGKVFSSGYKAIRNNVGIEHQLKKIELENKRLNLEKTRQEMEEKEFADEIRNSAGFVNHEDLQRAGVPLVVTEVRMSDEEFQEFAAHCKREGIIISGIEDIRERELNQRKVFILECKESDLVRVKGIIDLMNDIKRIEYINNKISEIAEENASLKEECASLENKEELTEEETARLSEIKDKLEENVLTVNALKKQIEDIRESNSRDLNLEQDAAVIDTAVHGETLHGVDFNEAVDRWTGSRLDEDTTCYIVDAKNPDNYIQCNAKNDNFRGEDYIKSTYDVYKDGKHVATVDDGRFEGRQWDYWTKTKQQMRKAGDIGDLVYKFYSLEKLNAYREAFKAQNQEEIEPLDVGQENRDYGEIISNLEKQLDELGYEYDKEAVAVRNKESKEEPELSDDMDMATRAEVAEAVIIGKQIANYEAISALEEQVALARAEVLTSEGAEQEVAQAQLSELESTMETALSVEAGLVEQRMNINAVQAEQEVAEVETPSLDIEAQINNLEAEIQQLGINRQDMYDKFMETGDYEHLTNLHAIDMKIDSCKVELSDLKAQHQEQLSAKSVSSIPKRKERSMGDYKKEIYRLKDISSKQKSEPTNQIAKETSKAKTTVPKFRE